MSAKDRYSKANLLEIIDSEEKRINAAAAKFGAESVSGDLARHYAVTFAEFSGRWRTLRRLIVDWPRWSDSAASAFADEVGEIRESAIKTINRAQKDTEERAKPSLPPNCDFRALGSGAFVQTGEGEFVPVDEWDGSEPGDY